MSESKELDPGDLTLEMMSAHLESVFHLEPVEGEPIALTLTEAVSSNDHRPDDQKGGRIPFTLVFDCPSYPLPQGSYRLIHESLGALIIFMTPFAAFEKGHKLEAIFS